MKTERITLNFGGKKKIEVKAKRVGMFSYGLMFRTRQTRNLVFKFKHEVDFKITGLFVFFPFIAVWLDADGKVLEARKINPFVLSALPKNPFSTLVEIPINKRNRKILDEIERFK